LRRTRAGKDRFLKYRPGPEGIGARKMSQSQAVSAPRRQRRDEWHPLRSWVVITFLALLERTRPRCYRVAGRIIASAARIGGKIC
jgi:hypothetical protein